MAKGWKEKVEKEYPDFVAEVSASKIDELNPKLLQYSKHMQEIEDELEKLLEEGGEAWRLKETLKEILGPAKDAQKMVKLKMRYINSVIKDKGGQ